MSEQLAVIGLGYVGCVTAACLAQHFPVIGVDRDPTKVASIQNGRAPFYEPQLDSSLSTHATRKNLVATTDIQRAAGCSHYFVCVGTPTRPGEPPDLSALNRVMVDLQKFNHTSATIVIRSTVPPGTTAQLHKPASWSVLHNPEFLREGCAMSDFLWQPFIVIGGEPQAAIALEKIYQRATQAPRIYMLENPADSEMLKYACNAYHATKIVFANEIGLLCQKVGADPNTVMYTLCQDGTLNISDAYLRPGFAFGGSCLPKDLRALEQMHSVSLHSVSPNPSFMGMLLARNHTMIQEAATLILERAVSDNLKVFLVGTAFKGCSGVATDDVRESPAIILSERIQGCLEGLRSLSFRTVPFKTIPVLPQGLSKSEFSGGPCSLGVITYHFPGWENVQSSCKSFLDLSKMPWQIVTGENTGAK